MAHQSSFVFANVNSANEGSNDASFECVHIFGYVILPNRRFVRSQASAKFDLLTHALKKYIQVHRAQPADEEPPGGGEVLRPARRCAGPDHESHLGRETATLFEIPFTATCDHGTFGPASELLKKVENHAKKSKRTIMKVISICMEHTSHYSDSPLSRSWPRSLESP